MTHATLCQHVSLCKAHACCWYTLQVFHLPSELMQAIRQQQQPPQQQQESDDIGSDSTGPECSIAQQLKQHTGEFARIDAVDTGHWGKRLHEPSAFLSHDLWSKLGETCPVV